MLALWAARCVRPPGRTIIDRLATYQTGATAIWLTPHGPRTETDRDVQGARPWVPAWPD